MVPGDVRLHRRRSGDSDAEAEAGGLLRQQPPSDSATQDGRPSAAAVLRQERWLLVLAAAVVGPLLCWLAAGYKHWFGVALGAGATAYALARLRVIMEAAYYNAKSKGSAYTWLESDAGGTPAASLLQPSPGESAGTVATARKVAARAFPFLAWAWILLSILQLVVRLNSPDPPPFLAFPAACPAAKPLGCSRVADANPNLNKGLEPFKVKAPQHAVLTTIETYLARLPRASVLQRSPALLHARVVTFFWGFADDFLVGVTCANGVTEVQLQGCLRMGQGDFDVNYARNKQLLGLLAAKAETGGFKDEGKC